MQKLQTYLFATLFLGIILFTGCSSRTENPTAPEEAKKYEDQHSLQKSGTNCVKPPSDLISWWPGDGDANDIVGGNHGTLQNGAAFASGMVDQAFNFDGVDDFVRVSSVANLEPQQFTIDAWVFPTGPGNYADAIGGVVVSKDIGSASVAPFISYMLSGPGTTGKFRAGIGITDLTPQPVEGYVGHPTVFSTNSFLFNTWLHVAMTWDGSVLKLYVNGILEGQLNLGPKTIFYSGEPVSIGRHNVNTNRAYNGLIDEVEIFNRALTSDEIAAIFNAGSAGKCKKVTICHKPGTPAQKTLVIPIQALAGHLGHGDTIGPCQ